MSGRINYPWYYTVTFVYVNLAEAVVMAVTFGKVMPAWGLKFAFWWAQRCIRGRVSL